MVDLKYDKPNKCLKIGTENILEMFRNRLKYEISKGEIYAGIYQITSPTNKVYIGQSRNIQKRFLGYISMGCKRQPKLYNSFLKYGVENHEFKIIVRLKTWAHRDKLNINEKLAIQWFKDNGADVLNLTIGGENPPLSLETRAKISASRKGKYTGENNPNYGKGCFGDKNGSWKGELSTERIKKEARKKRVEIRKLIKAEKEIQKKIKNDLIIEKRRIKSEQVKPGQFVRSVIQFKNGIEIKTHCSIVSTAKELNIPKHQILRSCNGLGIRNCEFTFKFKSERPVV